MPAWNLLHDGAGLPFMGAGSRSADRYGSYPDASSSARNLTLREVAAAVANSTGGAGATAHFQS